MYKLEPSLISCLESLRDAVQKNRVSPYDAYLYPDVIYQPIEPSDDKYRLKAMDDPERVTKDRYWLITFMLPPVKGHTFLLSVSSKDPRDAYNRRLVYYRETFPQGDKRMIIERYSDSDYPFSNVFDSSECNIVVQPLLAESLPLPTED